VGGRSKATKPREAELLGAAAYRTALRRFLHRTESVANEAGLTSQRYDLLLMIAAAGELRVTELCDLLDLQQTAVTELVKRTEEAGLITRHPGDDDGRVRLVRLTPEGRRRLLHAFAALRDDRESLRGAFREVDRRFRAAAG